MMAGSAGPAGLPESTKQVVRVTSWSQWRRGRFWAEIVLAVLVGVAAFVVAAAVSTAARSHVPAVLLGLLLLLAVLAVARLPRHLIAGAIEQAGQALAEQDIVLGQHHPRPGHDRALPVPSGPVLPLLLMLCIID